MDTTYQGWNLVFHKAEKGRLTEDDRPPYDINILKKYFQYTYMACGQVGGVKALDVARMGLMVLAADV